MNEYTSISTEYLVDKFLYGIFTARDFIIIVLNMSTMMILLDTYMPFTQSIIVLLILNAFTITFLKIKIRESYLELYLLKRFRYNSDITVHLKLESGLVEDEEALETKKDDQHISL